MSTSMIMRPISPSTPTATHKKHDKHKQSESDNYTQKERREFLSRMYNHNSTPPINGKSSSKGALLSTSLLSTSSTDNAESDSFILDSRSPLFTNVKAKSKSVNVYSHKPVAIPNANVINKSFSAPVETHTETQEIKLEMEEIKRRQSNIHQNINIIPPTKMRKKASKKELKLVLNHYKIAKNKDIECILGENESHVLYYRDKLYKEAKENGINSESNDYIRLKILGAVVEFTYMNIEPPNEYTKQTDRKHFKEVGAWAAKFAKNKGIIPPLTLIYSAWCHDIERFIPGTKCEYLPESVDKYRKQVIHGITSAKVATCLLKGAPVTDAEKERIYQMILYHDIPNPREDICILGEILIPSAPESLMEELGLLMDADSFAFFQSTIYFFILFKSKKNSPDWIWERVLNNLKRLRPYLREKAVKSINKLPKHLLNKMSIDYNQLKHICSQSGRNSPAKSFINSTTNSPNISIIKKNQKSENINDNTKNIFIINNMKINDSNHSTSDSNSHVNDM